MPLTDYKGASNCRDLFPHLVGETIKAAFRDNEGRIWIVCGSGEALVLGGDGGPSYWKADANAVRRIVESRRKDIEARLSELRDMPGVELP